MASAATWVRTLRSLHPQQIVGRPSYRVRRFVAPHLAQAARPWAFESPRVSCALPPTSFTEPQLEVLRTGELALVGFSGGLPEDAPFNLGCSDPLYIYEFHQLGWLVGAIRLLPASDPLAIRLEQWLVRYLSYEHLPASPYWDAYPLASRLLGLLPLWATGRIRDPRVGHALRAEAIAIQALQETHLQGNHLLRSRAAAAAASLFLVGPGADLVRRRCWRALASEARSQFLADGVHEERTPAYHLLCSSDLLTCVALAREFGFEELVPDLATVVSIAGRASAASAAFEHDDGRVAAFGDTAPLSSLRPMEIREFAEAVGAGPVDGLDRSSSADWLRVSAETAGFSALRSGDLAVYVTHGNFGAPHQPGHAHCDLFALEVDLEGHRLIVDPGVHGYHDALWRNRSRATAEHATPSIEGKEQAEIWSRFRCGWRPKPAPAQWQPVAEGWTTDLTAEAFGPDPLRLRRSISTAQRRVVITDELPVPFSVALPLAPDVAVDESGEGRLWLRHPGGSGRLLIEVVDGEVTIEPCSISHAFGAQMPSRRVRLKSGRATRLSWSLQA